MPGENNKIKMPAIATMAKTDVDVGAAYINAVMEIPAKLEEVVNLLDATVGCLVIMTDAIRKRAIADSVFEIDEYKNEMEELTSGESGSSSEEDIPDVQPETN